MKYSNTTGISLPLAVFLATDNYDYSSDKKEISVTSMMRPLRQLILGNRVEPDSVAIDIAGLVSSRLGTAIHNGVENAWINNHQRALKALGIPSKTIEKVKINPTEVAEGDIPVYLEQRENKQVQDWKVTGKFDIIVDGQLSDIKSTSTYTATNKTKDKDYIIQGSLYRWLNPTKVTEPTIAIQWIFTDWSKARAMSNPSYPQGRIMEKKFDLMSVEQTDKYVRDKISDINKYWDAPEEELPLCNDEDLWRSDPIYKYYKNPNSTVKSTKNFTEKQEAFKRYMADGRVGKIIEIPGKVTACKYCPGFSLCKQKDALIASGELELDTV